MMAKVIDPVWRELYTVAGELVALAPWERCGTDLSFGVPCEALGETAYVAIYGELGQHRAITFYRGDSAFRDMYTLLSLSEVPEVADYVGPCVVAVPQIQVVAEESCFIGHDEKKWLKGNKVYSRRGEFYPVVRICGGQLAPHVLMDMKLAKAYLPVLRDALAVLPMMIAGQQPPVGLREDLVPVLKKSPAGDKEVNWRVHSVKLGNPGIAPVLPRPEMVAKLRTLPRSRDEYGVALFRGQEPTVEAGELPSFLLFLLGYNVATDLLDRPFCLEPENQLEVELLDKFCLLLMRCQYLPERLKVWPGSLAARLSILADALQMELEVTPSAVPSFCYESFPGMPAFEIRDLLLLAEGEKNRKAILDEMSEQIEWWCEMTEELVTDGGLSVQYSEILDEALLCLAYHILGTKNLLPQDWTSEAVVAAIDEKLSVDFIASPEFIRALPESLAQLLELLAGGKTCTAGKEIAATLRRQAGTIIGLCEDQTRWSEKKRAARAAAEEGELDLNDIRDVDDFLDNYGEELDDEDFYEHEHEHEHEHDDDDDEYDDDDDDERDEGAPAPLIFPGNSRSSEPKTGRNDPCPCGSGKKFNKCCG